jgi:REP element-mobilizing transposase RayT
MDRFWFLNRFWFLTWTTYGTWLPGDERGFVSELRDADWNKYLPNQPRTEYPTDNPALRRYAASIMRGEPVWLTDRHADDLAEQFAETATCRKWVLFGYAVMPNHTHVLVAVGGDPDPSAVLGDFKEYGSRRLNRKWGRPAAGTWWTGSGSRRKLPDARAVRNTLAYIRDQWNPLVVWLNEGAIRGYFDEVTADGLLSPEREPET